MQAQQKMAPKTIFVLPFPKVRPYMGLETIGKDPAPYRCRTRYPSAQGATSELSSRARPSGDEAASGGSLPRSGIEQSNLSKNRAEPDTGGPRHLTSGFWNPWGIDLQAVPRRMKPDVWMEAVEAPVGTLERHASKSLEFSYAPGVPKEGRLSAALPIKDTQYGDAACTAFCGNLLFEGRELDRVMAAHRIDRGDIGSLLFHLGADCPGAVSMHAGRVRSRGKRPGVFPDDYEEVPAARLRPTPSVAGCPWAAATRRTRSLAGRGRAAQDRGRASRRAVLSCREKGRRAPTTHILKVSPRDEPGTCCVTR